MELFLRAGVQHQEQRQAQVRRGDLEEHPIDSLHYDRLDKRRGR